jgi:hypothetical protein
MGDVGESAFYAFTGTMSCTISDVVIGNARKAFRANNDISGKITSVTMRDATLSDAYAFYSVLGNISGIISNIIIGTGFQYLFFTQIGDISGKISDITIVCSGGTNVFRANSDISGTITNVIVNNTGPTNFQLGFFAVTGNISGTISYIKLIGNFEQGFFAFGSITGIISHIIMNNITTRAFSADTISGIISYVKSNGNIFGPFKGKLINCELDCTGKGVGSVVTVGGGTGIIERCKLLSDKPGFGSITSTTGISSAQIIYTVTNYGITNITNVVSPNYNLIIT